jgi:hypothetical protein
MKYPIRWKKPYEINPCRCGNCKPNVIDFSGALAIRCDKCGQDVTGWNWGYVIDQWNMANPLVTSVVIGREI